VLVNAGDHHARRTVMARIDGLFVIGRDLGCDTVLSQRVGKYFYSKCVPLYDQYIHNRVTVAIQDRYVTRLGLGLFGNIIYQ
jgi:hypothetical protein